LNGQIFIEDSPTDVSTKKSVEPFQNADYEIRSCGFVGTFNEEINESNWQNKQFNRVVYKCDLKFFLISDNSNRCRECVNGSWTGEIPQCGECWALN
jgi:hypothetical protein